MGFLKFLKRGKDRPNNSLENLDMPPPPPEDMVAGAQGEVDEAPSFENDQDSSAQEEYATTELSDFEQKQDFSEQDWTPSPPPMPQEQESMPVFEKPKEEQKPLFEKLFKPKHDKVRTARFLGLKPGVYEEEQRLAVEEERDLLAHRNVARGPAYIRVDRFRHIFDGVNDVRVAVKRSGDSIQSAIEKEMIRDKDYDRLKATIVDVQKKFMFVEQTIFKR